MKYLALVLLLPALLAQTPAPPTDAASTMAAEIARLRAENAKLREQLSSMQSQPAPSPSTVPATQPVAPHKAFTNMFDILTNIPIELRPQSRPDWYKFTAPKFESWWAGQLAGMDFDQVITFGKPAVTRMPVPRPGAEWVIYSFACIPKTFPAFGQDHTWTIRIPPLYLDEAGARKWDALNDHTLMRVKATIREAHIENKTPSAHDKMPTYSVILDLTNVQFPPPN